MTDTKRPRTVPCTFMDSSDASCALGRVFPGDCADCGRYRPGLDELERTRCEVWTRVMGYHRSTDAFNVGKAQEHKERVYFVERHGDLDSRLPDGRP